MAKSQLEIVLVDDGGNSGAADQQSATPVAPPAAPSTDDLRASRVGGPAKQEQGGERDNLAEPRSNDRDRSPERTEYQDRPERPSKSLQEPTGRLLELSAKSLGLGPLVDAIRSWGGVLRDLLLAAKSAGAGEIAKRLEGTELARPTGGVDSRGGAQSQRDGMEVDQLKQPEEDDNGGDDEGREGVQKIARAIEQMDRSLNRMLESLKERLGQGQSGQTAEPVPEASPGRPAAERLGGIEPKASSATPVKEIGRPAVESASGRPGVASTASDVMQGAIRPAAGRSALPAAAVETGVAAAGRVGPVAGSAATSAVEAGASVASGAAAPTTGTAAASIAASSAAPAAASAAAGAGAPAAAGTAGVATAGVTVAAALGGVALVAGAVVGAMVLVTAATKALYGALSSASEKLAAYSPDVAGARGMSEVRSELAMYRRAERIGPELAQFEQFRGKVDERLINIGTTLLEIGLRLWTKAEPAVDSFLEFAEVSIESLAIFEANLERICAWLPGGETPEEAAKRLDPVIKKHIDRIAKILSGEEDDPPLDAFLEQFLAWGAPGMNTPAARPPIRARRGGP